ncbi:MAG: nucleotidyltransferase [Candidatus Marsarchaeota archaeon]|nr:nucleotidyltransferase [Candidatus Marsarchaeota archaeon]
MGGSGGSYFSPKDIESLREEARRRLEQSRIDAEVNSFLQRELVGINDRDSDKVDRYMEQIESALRDRIEEVDRLLFGGSVAKHTYVDGLSDVDSLVVLKDGSLESESPAQVREQFREALERQLPRGNIQSIRTGNMAVTIEYRDGTEIQLLPAIQIGNEISISSRDGRSWIQIRPREFAQALTESNRAQGGAVVPAIKLAKAILDVRLGDKSPSGYHTETLAVAAFRDYTGSRTPKAMLTHLFESAAERVLRPIGDVTGQSRYVDDSLGPADSAARRHLSNAFREIAKTMSQSRKISDWHALLE